MNNVFYGQQDLSLIRIFQLKKIFLRYLKLLQILSAKFGTL